MEISSSLTLFLPSVEMFLSSLLGSDPLVRILQVILGASAGLLVFLVFWTTRDILKRTRSVLAQLVCILLVALLPIVGFFLYLLLRPTRTIRERELDDAIAELLRTARAMESVPV